MILSVALGTALQASGVGGPVASVAAWSVVVLLTVFLLFQHARTGRGEGSLSDLALRTRRMGHSLVDFGRVRRASAPRQMGHRWWFGRSHSRREYEDDTMSLFRERFGEPLLKVVDDLRRTGLIGLAEARRLTAPSTPDAIERVGHRLIELGAQMATP